MDTLTRKVALGILKERKGFFAEIEADRLRHANKGLSFPYCKHGTFIGDPYGADYMCGACEMGEDNEADQYAIAIATAKKLVDEFTNGIVLLSQVMRITGSGPHGGDGDDDIFNAYATLRNAVHANTIGRYLNV